MYQVEFLPGAKEDLARLSPEIARRVLMKAQWLAGSFDQLTPEVLTGQNDLPGTAMTRPGSGRPTMNGGGKASSAGLASHLEYQGNVAR